ncbi:alanine racemase [Aestuariimicrobium soli]|uniref:alanine racemase n=1 Tax=Aestuariimicrobium soli TaxID=2035834 RepID=UPI003EBE56BD
MTSQRELMQHELMTPALLVDVARLEANIATVHGRFAEAGVALRPHVKTSKCLEVASRQRAAGAVGFTCSTPAEVEWLSRAGFGNLVWAHQPVGPAKVTFAVRAADLWGVKLIADSVAVARPLSEQADRVGVDLELVLDVDSGQHRTGVTLDEVIEVARAIEALPRVSVVGVLTHEGHVGATSGREARGSLGSRVGADMARVADELRAAGLEISIVSVGSTPGWESAPFAAGVSEGRPGTYVYFDANQVRGGTCTLEQCALTVLATVVSVHADRVIIDAGLKAMSADTFTPEVGGGIVCDLELNPLSGVHFASANEEHGFLTGDLGDLAVGDRVRIVPNHACGAVNMWSGLTALLPDGTSQRWAIEARH